MHSKLDAAAGRQSTEIETDRENASGRRSASSNLLGSRIGAPSIEGEKGTNEVVGSW